ncbi:DNA-binding transcriptional MocR family regulator [Chelatococcus asaccharovorans]|uniref:DNA-binding transcriptional MocR family regulator n=2 Tax=Chelatococcus asaccharovorans TaxID=28210 RepID=A0A2V3TXQ1_9HYPH|nr:DNA-binding transcriptional MocR family regulator [Chelatococcus asaccharovorans]
MVNSMTFRKTAVSSPPDAETAIDFTRSIPPFPALLPEQLGRTLTEFAQDPQFAMSLRTGLPGGSARDRKAGAQWLSSRFREEIAAERVVVTNGTQGALLLLLEQFVGPGGLLLAEELSYAVLQSLAERAHVKVKGLPLDAEGILPEAFEHACRTDRPRALYCNPTVHNPTTAIMSETRRLEIAAIARHFGVWLIEDDPLGRLHPDAPRPIAAIAPDVTWYIMGVTKCLAHGLRVAYLVAPSPASCRDFVEPIRRLSHWFPAPMSTAVATHWIETGTAEQICSAIREEAIIRQTLAAEILAGADIASPRGAMHLWLRLPDRIGRHDFAARLEQRGVLVRTSELFAVDERPCPSAVRISLSSPLQREDVARGVAIVGAALTG